MGLGSTYRFEIIYICLIVVADFYPGLGVCSDAESVLFVCDVAVDTPAQDSDATSVLHEASFCHSRTQQCSSVVRLVPSVVQNEWEQDMLLFPYCVLHQLFCLPFLVLSRFFYSVP